jgi:hypothetical protein
MPVTYHIDAAKRLIHTRCVGPVTPEDVVAHFAILIEDPACPDWLDVLLDLSEMTSLPASDQLRDVASTIARIRARVQFGRCAIIAPQDALFGMSRMFEVYAQDYFVTTQVFRAVHDGTRWLESRPA